MGPSPNQIDLILSIIEIVSADLQRLYDDWNARAGGWIPRRCDFDVLNLRYILGNMSLIDVRRGSLRFFYRLHGTGMTRWSGRDLTGKFLDDAPNEEWAARARKHLAGVVGTGMPSVVRHFDLLVDHQLWNAEVLVLPLSRDGRQLDMLISAVVPHQRMPWCAGQQPHSETKTLWHGHA